MREGTVSIPCLLGLSFLACIAAGRPLRADDLWANPILPFLKEHCTECHGVKKPKAGLDLAAYGPESPIRRERKQWKKVHRMLRRGKMPPEKAPQPPEDDRQSVVKALDEALAALNCDGVRDPGHVTLRRLNRTEYNNVVADLFGIDFKPAEDFPADDSGYGFDNIGDVLSLSPVLFDKYLAAAERITDEVVGGTSPNEPSSLLTCLPESEADWQPCARQILEPVASRAFRRPLRDGEMEGLLSVAKSAHAEGASFEQGIQLALQAILVSPDFLFHVVEIPAQGQAQVIEPLSGFELAERMSFFLWSRLPDEELVALAKAGKLTDPAIVEQQVRRMLKDKRSSALADNFAAQWLQLRRMETITPDPDYYPAFDDDLRRDSRRESELFFSTVASGDLSVLTLLDADFSIVNERLARHYGIPDIKGAQFRRVSLEDGRRGGILGHASILTLTSNPTRTSPVKRGKWI